MDINKLIKGSRVELLKNIIKSKNYDALYNIFGKKTYMLFTPFSHKKKDIKKLMEKKNYPLIYNKYGKIETLFIKQYKKLNKEYIESLGNDGRFYELYELYGDEEFYKNENTIAEREIYEETGSMFKVKLYKVKESISEGLKDVLVLTSSIVIPLVFIGGKAYYMGKNLYEKELKTNKELIELYDEKVNEYANSINELGLDNDLDVVMKVMYDTWNSMGGYGEPSIDSISAYRLDLLADGGQGKCRNIADDFSAKLNAINPEYNARNIIVTYDDTYYTSESFSNIPHKYSDMEVNKVNGTIDSNDDYYFSFLHMLEPTGILGDHMATLFEPIDKDYTILVDATNPSIGVIANGEIYMFSNEDGKGLEFKPMGQIYQEWNYDFKDVAKPFFSSFVDRMNEEELDSLNEEWGINAQNESIIRIENIEKNRSR